jgi:hypothetical protein
LTSRSHYLRKSVDIVPASSSVMLRRQIRHTDLGWDLQMCLDSPKEFHGTRSEINKAEISADLLHENPEFLWQTHD